MKIWFVFLVVLCGCASPGLKRERDAALMQVAELKAENTGLKDRMNQAVNSLKRFKQILNERWVDSKLSEGK